MRSIRKRFHIPVGWRQRPAAVLLAICLSALLVAAGQKCAVAADDPRDDVTSSADPLFDLPAIMNDPVEYTVLSQETVQGVIFENFEFTSRMTAAGPERVQGIYAHAEGGRNLPGVLWCMGGMAPADRYFPGEFARKGYAALAITLPHALRHSFQPFDAAHPETANLTLLARDQLRAVTVLSQRPEVNPQLMGVAGASYGGVFATLVAGVDPRLKAGTSFFAGGNHALGTNLPQFTGMKTPADVEVWNRTIDGAFRLRKKAVPFMWGVAFNDNWFFFPAVAQTFAGAASAGKRMAVLPHWQHGFLPPVDKSLIDFLDTSLRQIRPAYNAPGGVKISRQRGEARAEWSWTGSNAVQKAELIASYGEPHPWLGWLYRASFIFRAEVRHGKATARLPIPSHRLPVLVWGNITDSNGVVTSTPPLTLRGSALRSLPLQRKVALNAFIDSDLGEEVRQFYALHHEPLGGVPDPTFKHGGTQSLRVDPPAKETDPVNGFVVKRLFHVPGLGHQVRMWVAGSREVELQLTVTPVRPGLWRSPLVRELVAREATLAPLLPRWADPVVPLTATMKASQQWREIQLTIPVPTAPVEGYKLELKPLAPTNAQWWVDTVSMTPVWP